MSSIVDIEYALPEKILTNDELALDFPDWPASKILSKTGIKERHITDDGEYASDLACKAASNLLSKYKDHQIDYIIYCTQSPDLALPTTACLIQERLGLSTNCGALDINLGCSGFVYGLGLSKGLIDSEQAESVLLLNADTYSKYINKTDKNVRVIFGDAGSATLISKRGHFNLTGPFIYGTDGKGKDNLIVPKNGCLFMNGPEIFSFTMKVVPQVITSALMKASLTIDDIDLFVFHQANSFMMKHLQSKLSIPDDKFIIDFEDVGNTVSCTIPIALKRTMTKRKIHTGNKIMLVGFGVGYSWGATIIESTI